MARPNPLNVPGSAGRPGQPREFAEELRALQDADNPSISGDPRALKKPPTQMDQAPGLRPVPPRPVHRVIQRRPRPANESAAATPEDDQAPSEDEPVAEVAEDAMIDSPEIEAPMTQESESSTAVADTAVTNGHITSVEEVAQVVVRGLPNEDENDLLHVLCFLEERSLPELVEAVIREYLESRAADEDVQAVLKARGKYRRV